jgi:CRISPR-associated protein Cas5d
MNHHPPLEVKVWGELACFTRPEMKVERVSYPVMTPSAARGILEAIFWKPEFSYQIREIWVLNPVKHFSILRNEVNNKAVTSSAQKGRSYYAEEDRAQRHTLALRDVAYLVKADIALAAHATDNEAKYRDQFRRRASRGQCCHRPYLGCREFAASFGEPDGSEKPIPSDDDLGLMLFDLIYQEDGKGPVLYGAHDRNGGRLAVGTARPKFFEARLEGGVLRVPAELYRKGG